MILEGYSDLFQSAVDCSSTGENGVIRAQVVYPLHAAARHSHIQCLQILRLGGFDIDFVTDEGSALHVAAMFGQVDAVKYLTSEDYIQRLESDHFNSSSDSGIDRRDSERSIVDDDINCDIWRPLPSGRNSML
ncbi:hypothetical protein Y032_0003g1508 [Ancylostoma ceylanicum]|uniref:Uncharacterized protein n=1 Tax=Ancylostoma ceylanicum TaxID=53326 RepID=A0A016VZ36_9BILA|nr:hypothetical protein Y032_0003g1508 [Ancylostoma ceylanicum]